MSLSTDSPARVNTTVESFVDWSRPNEFFQTVTSAPGLTRAALELVDAVISESTDARHWADALEFKDGATRAGAALRAAHPWLSAKALENLLQHASYSWK